MVLALAAGAAWCAPAPAAHLPPLARGLRVPLRIAAPGVALTFDDGPHARGTPAVLDALAAAGARATFFLVGEQVRRRAALAGEIAAAGHAVALHGDRHRSHLRLTPSQVAEDLRRAADTVGEATGAAPAWYRPPYGTFSLASLALVRRRGWRPLLWSRWGRDWTRRATAASVAARATRALGPGDVVLLHDADDYGAPGCWRATAAGLPRILDELARLGLAAVALPGASARAPSS